MKNRHRGINSIPAFAASIVLGIAISLLLCQLLWLESAENRVQSYGRSLLHHSEAVAANLSDAIFDIDRSVKADCTAADQAELKLIAFEYHFIKDAGLFNGGKIFCSAMWGRIAEPYDLGKHTMITRSHFTLWIRAPSYSMPGKTFDITGTSRSFVVTSPTAFSPFENGAPELSAMVASTDGRVQMRRFGSMEDGGNRLSQRVVRSCSHRYDICVVAQINSNIFSRDHIGLLTMTFALGAMLGALFWVTLTKMNNRHRTIAAKLTAAIESDEITLLYQPIVQAATGRLVGFEALARWHDKDLGDIRPDFFISKASEIGMSAVLNQTIIRRAVRECAERLIQDGSTYLSINLGIDALLDKNTVNFLVEETSKFSVAPQQIAIEILESSTTDIALMQVGIEEVRRLGFQIFIDDFGTGYSGLAYLGKLDVDKIKIDRIFTQAAGTDSAAAMILLKIFEIARSIDTGIVFEGVETQDQVHAILDFCPDALAQGWLYSKAVPVEDISSSYIR